MLYFDVISIFPRLLDSYFQEAQLKRALLGKFIQIRTHNLRDHTTDRHKTVDDLPYGGGAGMVMKVEPIWKNLQKILQKSSFDRKDIRIILLSAKGKVFEEKKAVTLSQKYKQIIFICGRYEGVDERVAKKLADEEISLGHYVLSGGELGAAVIMDAVTRLLPGVLGNEESLKEESYNDNKLEYPQYTRPEVFKGWKVPKVLTSGNHELIATWRKKQQNRRKLVQ